MKREYLNTTIAMKAFSHDTEYICVVCIVINNDNDNDDDNSNNNDN